MRLYAKWIEPYDADANGCVEARMTVEDVIKCQRAYVSKYNPAFKYESDQQALDDFCAIHWATIKEES